MLKDIYKNKNFLCLILAQILSKMSDRIFVVGISWYLIKNFGSHELALFLTVTMLPYVIAVFLSGSLIKRLSSIRVIKYAEFLRAVAFLILAYLYFLIPQNNIHVLIVLVLCANTAAAIFNPALLVAPKELFSDGFALQSCLGSLNSCDSVSRLLGPVLAVPVYALFKVKGLILICAIAYLAAWLVELRIYPAVKPEERENSESCHWLKQPFAIISRYRLIAFLLVIFFLTNLFVIPIQIFLPILSKNIFDGGLKLLSYFEILLAVGMLLGGLYISARPFFSKPWQKISIPYALFALGYIGLSQSSSILMAGIALFLLGFFLAIGNVTTLAFFQIHTEAKDTPDIMAYVSFISTASAPIAMSLVGVLFNHFTEYQIITMYAIGAFLATGSILFSKRYRALKA